MRVLMVHNAYRHYGGEDAVVANEKALLEGGGHEVELLLASNDSIGGAAGAAWAALSTVYSRRGRSLVADAIGRFRPDVVHVHNHFPLISPSLFDATAEAGVPSVWTLHNFRMTCANGLLFRDGHPCEDCLGRPPISGVLHRCYRGSLTGSAVVGASISWHRARGTWARKVGRFIALNDFACRKFIEAGIPAERLVVKPNFVPDPGAPWTGERSGFVYVGRLSAEKGVATLVEAWRQVDAPLTIFGDGPELEALRGIAPANIVFAGHQDRATIQVAVARAAALILPSIWYENFPMVLVEAFAAGTPVIASARGALPSLIEDGTTGLLFRPGNVEALSEKVNGLIQRPDMLRRMGQVARACYSEKLTPEGNLRQLEAIYADASSELSQQSMQATPTHFAGAHP